MSSLPIEFTTLIEEKINQASAGHIHKVEYNNQLYWLKQRPMSKKNKWHRIQKFTAFCIPVPMLRPTVSQGGSKSLQQESQRLKNFMEKNIPVPEIICQTDNYLITKDCGQPLQFLLNNTTDLKEKEDWLLKAVQSLSELHRKELYHGRPSSKDMLVNQGCLYWIDLEDDPLQVMSLSEAQARDNWLLMVDLAKFTNDRQTLEKLCRTLIDNSAQNIQNALKKFIKTLKPIKRILKLFPAKIAGKEAQRAILINTIFESIIRSR